MLTRACLRVRLNPWFLMRNLAFFILVSSILASPVLARTAQFGDPAIIEPHPGDVLQGVVVITGSTDINGFAGAEISFTYTDDITGTWFLIGRQDQPAFNDTLAIWDTTVITDGNYILRLRVQMTDGSTRETVVPGLRVRNYSPIETPTAIPLAPEATPLPTVTPTSTPLPTPTSLPVNPARLDRTEVSASIFYGGLLVILVFAIIGFLFWMRRKIL